MQAGGCDEILAASNFDFNVKNKNLPGGRTYCIPAGNYRYLGLENVVGGPGNPVKIINCGGKVVLDSKIVPAVPYQRGSFGSKVRYVRITGSGDPSIPYGIELKNANIHGMEFAAGSSDIEVDHLEIHHTGSQGLGIKNYPSCDGLEARGNFVQYNTMVHHNYIHHTYDEGMYIGTSHYHLNTTLLTSCEAQGYLQAPLINAHVHHNLVEETGNDGIQVGGVISGMIIEDNVVKNYATKENAGHIGGLQINPGSVGIVRNNKVISKGGISETAVQYAGGSAGDIEITNNWIINSKTPFLILGMMLTSTNKTIFRNNTVVNDGGTSMYHFCYANGGLLSPTQQHQIIIEKNIFAEYDTVATSLGGGWFKIFDQGANLCPINGQIYGNAGGDSNFQIPTNLYFPNVNSAGLTNPAAGDYSNLTPRPEGASLTAE